MFIVKHAHSQSTQKWQNEIEQNKKLALNIMVYMCCKQISVNLQFSQKTVYQITLSI